MKKNTLSEQQIHILREGREKEIIRPFDEEFYARFADKYADCLPIVMNIKYCLPETPPKWCGIRSLRMFIALGSQNINLCTGKWLDDDCHCWLEEDNLVYCPTYCEIFPREMFYEIFNVRNIERETYDEFVKEYPNLQYRLSWFALEDYLPGGYWRMYLDMLLPWYEKDAIKPGREDFLRDLMAWEIKVKYQRNIIFAVVDDIIPKKIWWQKALQMQESPPC